MAIAALVGLLVLERREGDEAQARVLVDLEPNAPIGPDDRPSPPDLDEHTALERVTGRHDHFMGAEMVASQFATLEPTHGEPDVIVVAADQPLEGVLVGVAAALSAS